MNLAVRLLLAAGAALLVGAVLVFLAAREYNFVSLEDGAGLGFIVMINTAWAVLTVLSVLTCLTGLVLAYLARSVDVLADPADRPAIGSESIPTR